MNNKLPNATFIYNRYKKATPTKPASVELRITHNYKQKYISTGIMLYPHQWKNGKIADTPDIIQISQTLDKLLTNVRKIIYDMLEEGNINIYQIPDRLRQLTSDNLTFIDFCIQRSNIKEYGKASDTKQRYERFIRLFKQWGGIVEFKDITDRNIIAYDGYLISKGMKPYSKWNNYHRFLNSFIIDAVDAGYIKRNPYRWINIHKCKKTKGITRHLTPDEFSRLKVAKMPTVSIERVRDLFIFQTYTCLSYADLRDFDYKAVQEVKGVPVYISNRHKTKHTWQDAPQCQSEK